MTVNLGAQAPFVNRAAAFGYPVPLVHPLSAHWSVRRSGGCSIATSRHRRHPTRPPSRHLRCAWATAARRRGPCRSSPIFVGGRPA